GADIGGSDGEGRWGDDEKERKLWIWCDAAAGQRLSNRTESLTESSVSQPEEGSAPPPSSEGRAAVALKLPHPSAIVSIRLTAIPRTRKPLQSGYTRR